MNNIKKPLILVTNDDGITSEGIYILVQIAQQFGEVVVVAPNSPQSAKGHSITIYDPVHIQRVHIFEGIEAYECSGTPVDCVKLAIDKILSRKPALCVSGINHGSNASINVLYSGTMAAATEAALDGVPAIGFSFATFHPANFDTPSKVVFEIMQKFFEKGLPACNLLNVNIPNVDLQNLKGWAICRQARGKWYQGYNENITPLGEKCYWLSGYFANEDLGTDTDEYALANGFVSIVPVQCDLTAYKHLQFLNQHWL